MEFDWRLAEPLFARIEHPGYGDRENWMRWYKEAWEYLCSERFGLAETPLEECVIRLRIFSLGWLAHDFCTAVLRHESINIPDWSDWIERLDIEPMWCLLTRVGAEIVNRIASESPLSEATEIEDGELAIDRDEINRDLLPRFVLAAVYTQREKVVDALFRCFDGPEWLFATMYSNCCGIEEKIDQRRDELDDELDMLQEQLSEKLSETEREQLEKEFESVLREFDEKQLVKGAIQETRLNIAGNPIGWGGEESLEKTMGYEWCLSGCPIVVGGEPSFCLS